MLAVGAWLASASGPASALGHTCLPLTRRPGAVSPAPLGAGGGLTHTKETSPCDHPGSHPLVTSRPRALVQAARGHMLGAHTLTPGFVYPTSRGSCLAKPHRLLGPRRHKPTHSP